MVQVSSNYTWCKDNQLTTSNGHLLYNCPKTGKQKLPNHFRFILPCNFLKNNGWEILGLPVAKAISLLLLVTTSRGETKSWGRHWGISGSLGPEKHGPFKLKNLRCWSNLGGSKTCPTCPHFSHPEGWSYIHQCFFFTFQPCFLPDVMWWTLDDIYPNWKS